MYILESYKAQLVTWAKLGRPKPSRFVNGYKANKKHWRLANALYTLTNPNNAKRRWNQFDPEFNKLIRDLRPDWFESPTIRRRKLEREWVVEDAHLGFPKPNNLRSICRVHGRTLERELLGIRPDWFVNPGDEKSRLLRIMRRKEILRKLRLGLKLSGADRQFQYLSRQHNMPQYDPLFCQAMEKYGSKGAVEAPYVSAAKYLK